MIPHREDPERLKEWKGRITAMTKDEEICYDNGHADGFKLAEGMPGGAREALEEITAKGGDCIFGYAGITEEARPHFQHGSAAAFNECASIAREAIKEVVPWLALLEAAKLAADELGDLNEVISDGGQFVNHRVEKDLRAAIAEVERDSA